MSSQNEVLNEVLLGITTGGIKVVDLTQTLGPNTPVLKLPEEMNWKQAPKVKIERLSHFDDDGAYWSWNNISMSEHTGTHFDAPRHWISGQEHSDGFTDTIEPKNFIAKANVIDCSAEAKKDPDFLLTADRVKAWEKENGDIEAGEWVLMRTDWYKKGDDETAFLNIDETGSHTPGPSVDCIEYILSKGASGFGVETVGTDAGQAAVLDPPYPAHTLMHGANRYGLASLANLDKLPPKGAIIIAPPLKLLEGSGSPLRVLALVAN